MLGVDGDKNWEIGFNRLSSILNNAIRLKYILDFTFCGTRNCIPARRFFYSRVSNQVADYMSADMSELVHPISLKM